MKTKIKIFVTIIIIITTPLCLYYVIVEAISGRLIISLIFGIFILAGIWTRKKIIKGDVSSVEIKAIDEEGIPLESVINISEHDKELILSIFNRKAELFIGNDFEYSEYAIYIYTNNKKMIVLYPDKNYKQNVKINKYVWGVCIKDDEANELTSLIEKYV